MCVCVVCVCVCVCVCVNIRLKKESTVYQMWRRKVFKNHSFSKTTKPKVFRTCVMPILLDGAETWVVTQGEVQKKTLHMRCIQDILGFTMWDRRRNEELLNSKKANEQPIEEQMKEMRLRGFGHLQRMPDHWPQKQFLRFRPKGRREDQEVPNSSGWTSSAVTCKD